MVGLYSHNKVKALICISNAEGWGLPIYEASYTGLPVVSINWGGQTDFLNATVRERKKGSKKKTSISSKALFTEVDYTIGPIQEEAVWEGVLVKDSLWAYPEKESYQNALDKVYKNYDNCKDMAKKLKTWVKKEYEPDKQYDAFASVVLPAEEKVEEPVVSFD